MAVSRSQSPTQNSGYRMPFYEKYRKEAEYFDKEFIKKYNEDLNTTLIFMSRPSERSDRGSLIGWQARLSGSHLSVATLRGQRQKGQQVGFGCERGENYCIAIAIEEYIQ